MNLLWFRVSLRLLHCLLPESSGPSLQDGVFHLRGNCYVTMVHLGWFCFNWQIQLHTHLSAVQVPSYNAPILVMGISGYTQTQNHPLIFLSSSVCRLPEFALLGQNQCSKGWPLYSCIPYVREWNRICLNVVITKVCGFLQTPGIAEWHAWGKKKIQFNMTWLVLVLTSIVWVQAVYFWHV